MLPNINSHGLPKMPDVSSILDELQSGVQEIAVPKPPSTQDTENFFLGIMNRLAQKLSLPAFLPPMPPAPPAPPVPPGLPALPALPKTATPLKLPF